MTDIVFTIRNVLNRYTQPSGSFTPNLVGQSKESWEMSLHSLLNPIIPMFSPNCAYVMITAPQISNTGKKATWYEAFARTFLGFSMCAPRNTELIDLYAKGIASGTNPHNSEYWGNIRSNQVVVENASLAIGLLLSKKYIYDNLSEKVHENINHWFLEGLKKPFSNTNYLWFKVFHYFFLEQVGHGIYRKEIESLLNTIECFYQQEGWYSDGLMDNGRRFDYYSAWAFQFYPLMLSYLADYRYDKWKRKYCEHARQFLEHYQYFFTPDNVPPLMGRSQLYRFASISPWALAILIGCNNINESWIKKVCSDTVNMFLSNNACRKDGVLNMGYYDEFTPLLEKYSGGGSPYWALKGFSFLLIPSTHSFWKAELSIEKPKKKLHYISPIHSLLLHDGTSQVIMLNGGISSSGRYHLKYNKFAFSNRYPMNYDINYPIDNMLLLKKCNTKTWSDDRTIVKIDSGNKHCQFVWIPNDLDIIVETLLENNHYNSYRATHMIYANCNLDFAFGGFPVSNNEQCFEITKGNTIISVMVDKYLSGIKLLKGVATPHIYKKQGINPIGNFSCVPYFKGEINASNFCLQYEVVTE